jgi:hypothetical protein
MIIAGALLTVWGVMVYTGQADSKEFVLMLRDIIAGMGLYHATLTRPGE